MNILFTSTVPTEAAKMLADPIVNKMTVETAQLICTYLYKTTKLAQPYKPIHQGKELVSWLGESPDNFTWTVQYFKALCNEYKERSGKEHESKRKLESHLTNLGWWNCRYCVEKMTAPALRFVEECNYLKVGYSHTIPDAVIRYKSYLIWKYLNVPEYRKYTKRPVPKFLQLAERDNQCKV